MTEQLLIPVYQPEYQFITEVLVQINPADLASLMKRYEKALQYLEQL